MLKAKILIVEDDEDVGFAAQMVLRQEFERVVRVCTVEDALRELKKEHFQVVLLDMNLSLGETSGKDGLTLLMTIRNAFPATRVILNTAYGEVNTAVKAMKEGAFDFVLKPWTHEKLVSCVQEAVEENTEEEIWLGDSACMNEVRRLVEKVAVTDANVLLLGENGTGKGVVAKLIHEHSQRKGSEFVEVDLGTIPDTLFESELFGHKKGAFTDAKTDKQGKFELADKGTLFLDEIGNLSSPSQSKLLTAIQSGRIAKVGSSQSEQVEVRLICATNVEKSKLESGQDFRQDLLYRINTVEIEIPPLRDRGEDVALLAEKFVKRYAAKYERKRKLSAEALESICGYSWPGNVRELEHVIERAIILSENEELRTEDLKINSSIKKSNDTISLSIEEMERKAIREALKRNQGNLSKSAKDLGMGRTTLYRKIEKYGI